MTRPVALAFLILALAPSLALAQSAGRLAPGESGFVVTADVGGGTAFGAGSQYTPSGRLEGEFGAGYEFPYGIRPELALILGAAPGTYIGLRPGVHVALPDMPLYVRGALEWSTLRGTGAVRWVLAGAGGELRLTGVLGGFAEVDLGFPTAHGVGVGVLARVGMSLRL